MPSRTPSPSPSLLSIMCPGYKPLPVPTGHMGTPISTPLMRHNEGAEEERELLRPPLIVDGRRDFRTSGIFSGSTLSLSPPAVVEEPRPLEEEAPGNNNTVTIINEERGGSAGEEVGRDAGEEEPFGFRRVVSDASTRYSSPSSLMGSRPRSIDSTLERGSDGASVVINSSSVSSIDSDNTLIPSRPSSRLSPDGLANESS